MVIKFYIYEDGIDFHLQQPLQSFMQTAFVAELLENGDDYTTEITKDQDIADFFILPYSLDEMALKITTAYAQHFVSHLSHYTTRHGKHIFIKCDVGGCTTFKLNTSAIILNLNPSKKTKERNDIVIHHKVHQDIYEKYSIENYKDIKYDMSFQGCYTTHPIRLSMALALEKSAANNYYLNLQEKSYWFLSLQEREAHKLNYIQSMLDGWAVLCPRGTGSSSVRFFEALSLGRIPIVISDEYIFPLQKTIQYTYFTIIIPEKET